MTRRSRGPFFASGSLLASFLIGVAMGNIAWGVPIDAQGEFAGILLGLLHPYALLLGVTTVALFRTHGAIYVVMKTEGELQALVRTWINRTIIFFSVCYTVTTMATLLDVPHMAERVRSHPWLFSVAILNMLAIANVPREIHLRRDFRAFLSSCDEYPTHDPCALWRRRRPGLAQAGALLLLLQLLCLVAMEPMVSFKADQIRDRKLDVLHAVRPISRRAVHQFAVRG